MNELKDYYGIELSKNELIKIAIDILTKEYLKCSNSLEKATYSKQRIDALSRQEAVKYAVERLGGEYESK